LRRGHCLAHKKRPDNAPANQKENKHGQQSGPFKNTTLDIRGMENIKKRRGKRITYRVNKAAETG
jgi:hypothetical protein